MLTSCWRCVPTHRSLRGNATLGVPHSQYRGKAFSSLRNNFQPCPRAPLMAQGPRDRPPTWPRTSSNSQAGRACGYGHSDGSVHPRGLLRHGHSEVFPGVVNAARLLTVSTRSDLNVYEQVNDNNIPGQRRPQPHLAIMTNLHT